MNFDSVARRLKPRYRQRDTMNYQPKLYRRTLCGKKQGFIDRFCNWLEKQLNKLNK